MVTARELLEAQAEVEGYEEEVTDSWNEVLKAQRDLAKAEQKHNDARWTLSRAKEDLQRIIDQIEEES